MRYECPICGQGGGDHKKMVISYPCHAKDCKGILMLAEETPFSTWWNREGQKYCESHHLDRAYTRALCKIAWYNGAFVERTRQGPFYVGDKNKSRDPT